METPATTEFRRGVLAFRRHEPREAMYRIASFLVEEFWGQPQYLADGIGVLLLTWNQAHYRYGAPDFNRFEKCLCRNSTILQEFRHREIPTLSSTDHNIIRLIFTDVLEALEVSKGMSKGRRSPVATAKALHLLAPNYFPLWDDAIASAYGCRYAANPAEKYEKFMHLSKRIITELHRTIKPLLSGKTPLKVLDEFNYAKYTKQWI